MRKQINDMLQQARRSSGKKEYLKSYEQYREVLRSLDFSPNANILVMDEYAGVLEQIGKIDEAHSVLKKNLLSLCSNQKENAVDVIYARFALGEFLFRLGRYDEVLQIIEPSLKTNAKMSYLNVYLSAQVYNKVDNFKQLEKACVKLVELNPKRFKTKEKTLSLFT